MSATVGRRNPALLERRSEVDGLVPPGHVIVCAHKPLRHGDEVYTQGERIPGAETWDRLESRFRARLITTCPAEDAREHIDAVTDHPYALDLPEDDERVVFAFA